MSEINTEPAGTAGQGEPEPKTGKTFTEDEFNAHTARLRKAEEAKRAKLEQELTSLREAQKTEAEKQIDRVRQEVSSEWAAKLQAQAVDAEIKVRLLAKGFDPDLVHVVKAKAEIGTVEEVDAAIDAALSGKTWAQQRVNVPSQGGAPRGASDGDAFGPPWTGEKIRRVREAGQFAKYRTSIESAIARGEITG